MIRRVAARVVDVPRQSPQAWHCQCPRPRVCHAGRSTPILRVAGSSELLCRIDPRRPRGVAPLRVTRRGARRSIHLRNANACNTSRLAASTPPPPGSVRGKADPASYCALPGFAKPRLRSADGRIQYQSVQFPECQFRGHISLCSFRATANQDLACAITSRCFQRKGSPKSIGGRGDRSGPAYRSVAACQRPSKGPRCFCTPKAPPQVTTAFAPVQLLPSV